MDPGLASAEARATGTTSRALHTVFAQVLENDVVARLAAEKAALQEELATLRADPPRPCGDGVFQHRDGTYEGNWIGELCDDTGDCCRYRKVPHGRGAWVGDNGHTYTGDWRDGDRYGRGRLREGEREYEGDFQHDLPHGRGRWTAAGGWREGPLQYGFFEGTVRECRHGRVTDVRYYRGCRVRVPGGAAK